MFHHQLVMPLSLHTNSFSEPFIKRTMSFTPPKTPTNSSSMKNIQSKIVFHCTVGGCIGVVCIGTVGVADCDGDGFSGIGCKFSPFVIRRFICFTIFTSIEHIISQSLRGVWMYSRILLMTWLFAPLTRSSNCRQKTRSSFNVKFSSMQEQK